MTGRLVARPLKAGPAHVHQSTGTYAYSSLEKEIEITCHYNGAPEYRIELKAPDFKTAESLWEQVTSASLEHVVAAGGEAEAYRE